MSWIKNHFRHFVLPGIHTLARHGHQGALTVHDVKSREKQIRPSTKCKYVEAGLLYALVSSVLKKGDPTREIALGLCRQIGRAKDAEFVYAIDQRGSVKSLGEHYDGVEGSDVLHSMLCNSMRRLKRKMRRKGSLLLPGRDVWCWEVMARKLTVQSTFDARVSRSVAGNQKALRTCIDAWQIQDWEDILFFDTGFSGSIPRAIARAEGLPSIKMLLLSSGANQHQIFRTHTGSRAKALAFEYLAKYFKSGTHRDGDPYQELNPLDDFIKAALLTIWLWYHVSPQRLPSYRDKKIKRADPKLTSKYKAGGINPSNFGTVQIANTGSLSLTSTDTWIPVTGTSATTAGNFMITTDSAATSITGFGSSDTTLDQLWGAGATQQILVDQMQPPPPPAQSPGPPTTIMQELQKEIDQKIVSELLEKAGGDPGAIPQDKIPPSQMFEAPTPIGFKPAPKKIKPLVLNPETFTLHDAVTGECVEPQMDAKALGVFKGQQNPTEEGFGIGQYPGPPVVSAKKLKKLADMKPDDPGIPEVHLSIEMDSDPSVADGHPVAFKKTTLTAPDGTKKVFKTPITG